MSKLKQVKDFVKNNQYFVGLMCALFCLVGGFVILVLTFPSYSSQEISVTEYKLLRWDLDMDCDQFPDHCSEFKAKIAEISKDNKITNGEYLEYIIMVRDVRFPPNPNAKKEAIQEIKDAVKE